MTPSSEHTAETPRTTAAAGGSGGDTGTANPDVPDVPAILDWILGGFVVVVGLLFAIAGLIVYALPTRESVETVVASEEFQVDGMTEPEFVEVTLALLPWVAVGLLLTGLAMLGLGVAYLVHRRRVHARAAAGEPTSDYPAHALLGAMVTVLTSFVPFSGLIGGGVAGYLERGDSHRAISVGAASGVVLSAPFLVLSLFTAAGLVAGFAVIDQLVLGAFVAVAVIGSVLFSFVIVVALGALGGWLGGKLAEKGAL